MAQRTYSVSATGGHVSSVTESGGSSIGTEAVRVIIDDSNAVSKAAAVRMLKAILDYVSQDTWPPA